MTQPKHARSTRGGDRFYAWRSENFWSVTKLISSGVPKPALLPWGIKAVAEGAVSKRDILAAMLIACRTPRSEERRVGKECRL